MNQTRGNPFSPPAVPSRRRMFVALVVGVFSGVQTTLNLRGKPYPGDFVQVWFAARAILRGHDPYTLIGPGRPFAFDFSFRYPLSAAVVAIPVTPLDSNIACGVFVGLGLACLAWTLMRHGHAPLIGLLSASVASAIDSVQWSPLLAATIAIVPLGVVLAAKPTIGLAMFVARPSRWALLGGLAVIAVAFAFLPTWLVEWHDALSDRTGISTIVSHPGGAIALLGLLKWRRPEARMLAVLACVPMTPVLYETVPLLLIPRRWWEALLLVLASYAVLGWSMRVPLTDYSFYAAHMANSAAVIALVLYPLATLLVLRRPNQGSVPAWLERHLVSFPVWLRGGSGE